MNCGCGVGMSDPSSDKLKMFICGVFVPWSHPQCIGLVFLFYALSLSLSLSLSVPAPCSLLPASSPSCSHSLALTLSLSLSRFLTRTPLMNHAIIS